MRDIREFGVDLLRRLGEADMTAKKLAERSGASGYAIHTYINDGVVPSMKTLLRRGTVLPGVVEDWGDAVAEYYRELSRRRAETRRANGEGVHFAAAAVVDKPRKGKARVSPSRYGPVGTLAEVCRAARKAGLSYGQYVAAHSVAGKG